MPSPLLFMSIVLLLGAWFLLGRGSALEKFMLLFSLVFAYLAYRLICGATPQEILSPLINGINIPFLTTSH